MKRLTKWDWAAITIILVGAGFRLYHLFIFPFNEPFRLGGLFYEFSRQIVLNNFAFPETIPYYSAGGIPFAYPPLSFYVQAILIQLFNPPLFITVNLLPPLITLLSLPAFYWMIRQYTDDVHLALAGLFAYALIPTAFMNQIEAAGLAESFGVLTIILFWGSYFVGKSTLPGKTRSWPASSWASASYPVLAVLMLPLSFQSCFLSGFASKG